ncbi:MAG: Fe-Mn family superoxide dismutase, partial [Luteibaculaceae bacterium]
MAFELPALGYAKDALEPHIDAKTMEIHHGKHHAAYTSKLNDAIQGTEWEGKSIEDIMKNISKLSGGVRNNGGGYFNHCLFWETMSPNGGGNPSGDLAAAIDTAFGS